MGSLTEYVIGYFVGEPIKETYIFLIDISVENTLVIFTNKFGDRYWQAPFLRIDENKWSLYPLV